MLGGGNAMKGYHVVPTSYQRRAATAVFRPLPCMYKKRTRNGNIYLQPAAPPTQPPPREMRGGGRWRVDHVEQCQIPARHSPHQEKK